MTQTLADEPFSTVLSRAIQRRNLTLERLSSRLRSLGTPVSIATLSYWQSGRSIPTRAKSLKAVEHLERILSLPPGYLMNALPGDGTNRWDPLAVLPPDQRIYAVLEQMGLDLNRHLAILTVQDSLRLSNGGFTQHQTTRQLVRAEEDGVVHTPVIMVNEDEFNPPGLTAGTGCRFGQLAVLEDISTVVGELVLPQPLMRGDMVMFEYEVLRETEQVGNATPQAAYYRALPSVAPFLVLDLTMEDAPLAAEYVYREREDVPFEGGTHVPLPTDEHVQVSLRDAAPGSHGLAWTHSPDLAPGFRENGDGQP